MPKPNHSLSTVFILILVLVYTGYYAWKSLVPDSSTKQVAGKSHQNVYVVPVKKKFSANKQLDPKLNQTNSIYQKNLDFSSDPIINLMVSTKKYFGCKLHFTIQNKPEIDNSREAHFSKIQRTYFDNINTECEKLNKSRPELQLDQNIEQLATSQSLKSDTWAGKALAYRKQPLTDEETLDLFAQVAQDYPDLISQSMTRSVMYRLKHVNQELHSLIKSDDIHYRTKISHFGLDLMACELGAYCGSSSEMMVRYCMAEENFCVNDFITLHNTRLSQGVKADIQVVLQYYKNIYKVLAITK
ncbi:hypothetical protein MNBD_GAMMA03-2067 [hydrothermal vent metagenome]|uniref:Uncharacterized protein n=1 Tax=hydrothermal vent metagenome TaxID=652676 RepID=A0A3B0WAX5_9ZZZZ